MYRNDRVASEFARRLEKHKDDVEALIRSMAVQRGDRAFFYGDEMDIRMEDLPDTKIEVKQKKVPIKTSGLDKY